MRFKFFWLVISCGSHFSRSIPLMNSMPPLLAYGRYHSEARLNFSSLYSLRAVFYYSILCTSLFILMQMGSPEQWSSIFSYIPVLLNALVSYWIFVPFYRTGAEVINYYCRPSDYLLHDVKFFPHYNVLLLVICKFCPNHVSRSYHDAVVYGVFHIVQHWYGITVFMMIATSNSSRICVPVHCLHVHLCLLQVSITPVHQHVAYNLDLYALFQFFTIPDLLLRPVVLNIVASIIGFLQSCHLN